jgi:hypothetical protein
VRGRSQCNGQQCQLGQRRRSGAWAGSGMGTGSSTGAGSGSGEDDNDRSGGEGGIIVNMGVINRGDLLGEVNGSCVDGCGGDGGNGVS